MRLRHVTTTLVSIVALTLSVVPLFGQQTARAIRYNEHLTIGYLEYLPPGYAVANKAFPLLIFLHGSGESGNGSPQALESVKSWGPPSLIKNGHNMCFIVNGIEECFIVISPQIDVNSQTWLSILPIVVEHLMDGPDQYKIDPYRIYLTGLSRGGNGTYSYASGPGNSPNKLAAIAPIAAWADRYADGCIISARKIPVWAFHGRDDTVVPYTQGLIALNSIRDCTSPEPSAELRLTAYEQTFHDSWIKAYDPSHSIHDPNLYEWLLSHRRHPPDPDDGDVTSLESSSVTPISVFPNPARERFQLTQTHSGGSVDIEIVSITGATLLAQKDQPDNSVFDISLLPVGVYLVRTTTKTGASKTVRLVKVY